MATVWNIPQVQRTGFLPRLGRSLAGLFTIGAAFLVNAFVTGYATAGTTSYAIRIPVLAGLLVINAGLYFATFTLLTAKAIGPRGLLPGAVAGAVAFTALITVGTGLDNSPAEEHLGDVRGVRHGHRHRGVPAAARQAQHVRGGAEPGPGPPALSAGHCPWAASRPTPTGGCFPPSCTPSSVATTRRSTSASEITPPTRPRPVPRVRDLGRNSRSRSRHHARPTRPRPVPRVPGLGRNSRPWSRHHAPAGLPDPRHGRNHPGLRSACPVAAVPVQERLASCHGTGPWRDGRGASPPGGGGGAGR